MWRERERERESGREGRREKGRGREKVGSVYCICWVVYREVKYAMLCTEKSVCMCAYVCMRMYTCVCMYVCACIEKTVCMCLCVYACVRMYREGCVRRTMRIKIQKYLVYRSQYPCAEYAYSNTKVRGRV